MGLLQAVTDDSASDVGDQRLFLAGYLNSAEKWALFSDAWAEELKAAPAIDYFKMAEAQNRRDQFKSWSEGQRDEKLSSLARVIAHFKPLSFEVSVSRKEFFDILKPVSPRGLGNPHFTSVFHVVSILSRFASSKGGNIPIEFIFDEQDGVSDDIDLFFGYMKRNFPRKVRKLISGNPMFRDEKVYLPLQAADMIAWHVRREHELNTELPLTNLLRSDTHLVSEIENEVLQRWAHHHSQLPAVKHLQSKGQWRDIKREIARQSALGYIPPHGTRWKNFVNGARELIASLIRR
ncbi:hypothetical protein MesoLj113a_09820 [Mesorhizobium sp. 113-1-2]|uniref:DUF3800 domain-containing protein n=1 Tax=Mesorhizobium sp. 113-1-2 TaxID=2744515 RepID=UPI001927FCF5|nr:DUF3800 domain-containing protein [Mesorhizobium sp. 113-1-2]BCG69824.1 hypothetical protein MesoLj113a_09820 [Mesorhizobium sp. 113-1-2]